MEVELIQGDYNLLGIELLENKVFFFDGFLYYFLMIEN